MNNKKIINFLLLLSSLTSFNTTNNMYRHKTLHHAKSILSNYEKKISVIKKLLSCGLISNAMKIINATDHFRETLPRLVCKNDSLNDLKLILPYCHKKAINSANTKGETPLYYACKENDIKMVKLMLPKYTKKTINLKADHGKSTFYWASINNNYKLTSLLIINGFVHKALLHKINNEANLALSKKDPEGLSDKLLKKMFMLSVLNATDRNIKLEDTIFYKAYQKHPKYILQKLNNIIFKSKIYRTDLLKTVAKFKKILNYDFFYNLNEKRDYKKYWNTIVRPDAIIKTLI